MDTGAIIDSSALNPQRSSLTPEDLFASAPQAASIL